VAVVSDAQRERETDRTGRTEEMLNILIVVLLTAGKRC
jgi:hypothetical protein